VRKLDFIDGLAIGAIGAMAITTIIVALWDMKFSQGDAIQHNAAHYDAKTGVFTWNDEEKK